VGVVLVAPPRSLSSAILELLRNVDEERDEYLCLGEFGPQDQERLRKSFLPERVSDTLNIEGVNVNPRVTLAVLEGVALSESDRYAEQEIRNVIDAHDLVEQLLVKPQPLSSGLVKQIHFKVTKDLITTAGQFRPRDVAISGAHVTTPRWQDVPSRLSEMCEAYASLEDLHPIARAAWLHREFAEIHPFDDGNGRTGRLLQDLSMSLDRYLPVGISAFRRKEYYEALEQADFGDFEPLIAMIANSEQTALGKARRVISRGPDRSRAVQQILRSRSFVVSRRDHQAFELWRRRMDLLREETISWVNTFTTFAGTPLVRVKSWDPVSFDTWQEIRQHGWARNSWMFTVFAGAKGDPSYSVLFLVRRLDKVNAITTAYEESASVEPVGLQVAVSGEDGRYDFANQSDAYIRLKAIGIDEHVFLAYETGREAEKSGIQRRSCTEHEIFEEFFADLAVKAGWRL
jgi:Fic family protein